MQTSKTKRYLHTVWDFMIDVLFPKSEIAIYLESLSASDIISRVKMTSISQDEPYRAIFNYEDPLVRRMLWLLKYGGSRKAGLTLGRILGEIILEDISDEIAFGNKRKLLLVPIPLGKESLEKRGYNQSEIICCGIMEIIQEGLELRIDALFKTKETGKQSKTKKKEERLKNLKDSFGVRPPLQAALQGATVLLVDDIFTTGATFREASRTLRAAGAKKVICYAIAH